MGEDDLIDLYEGFKEISEEGKEGISHDSFKKLVSKKMREDDNEE